MNDDSSETFEQTGRTAARTHAQSGIALLARALNHCGSADVPHRYTADVQSRFHALAVEMVELVECGTIEANPAHAQHLKALAARGNKTLQSVIRRASRKTPIRGR